LNGCEDVKIVIFNVFEERAFNFCLSLLDKGFEVIAIDNHSIDMFSEVDEDKWLKIGRNANFYYEQRKEIIERLNCEKNLNREFYYFIKEDEIRSNQQDEIRSIISFCHNNNYKLNLVTNDEDFTKEFKVLQNLQIWIINSKEKWTETLKDLLVQILK
jgi:hypothetical protein